MLTVRNSLVLTYISLEESLPREIGEFDDVVVHQESMAQAFSHESPRDIASNPASPYDQNRRGLIATKVKAPNLRL